MCYEHTNDNQEEKIMCSKLIHNKEEHGMSLLKTCLECVSSNGIFHLTDSTRGDEGVLDIVCAWENTLNFLKRSLTIIYIEIISIN